MRDQGGGKGENKVVWHETEVVRRKTQLLQVFPPQKCSTKGQVPFSFTPESRDFHSNMHSPETGFLRQIIQLETSRSFRTFFQHDKCISCFYVFALHSPYLIESKVCLVQKLQLEPLFLTLGTVFFKYVINDPFSRYIASSLKYWNKPTSYQQTTTANSNHLISLSHSGTSFPQPFQNTIPQPLRYTIRCVNDTFHQVALKPLKIHP